MSDAQGLEPDVPSAATAVELEDLRVGVVDAAGVSAGLWLSYLFMFFYLLVAAAGVSQRDLFLENAVKLPFLNVDLPLTGFFWLGPALFLIVHAYTLIHFALLADKTVTYAAALSAKVTDERVRTGLRRRLPINIFVQFLAGPREVRAGPIGFLLRLIAWISLVIGPVALLLFFLLQFLPYHSASISWWQRCAVVIDLGLLWVLWPAVAHGAALSAGPWRTMGRGTFAVMSTATLAGVLLAFAVATYPGEALDGALPSFGLHEALVGGEVDFLSRRPLSVWSNRLVLPGVDAIDLVRFDTPAKIDAAPQTASLRMRNLDLAVLSGAVLSKVDLTGASLRGAQLQFAKLQGAELTNADLDGALLDGAQLQGAVMTGARMRGAELPGIQAQGAKLSWADMQGADLKGANLQGAEIHYALLQSAVLDGAEMQGAWFRGTQTAGASLRNAFVWRADGRDGSWAGALVVDADATPKRRCGTSERPRTCAWAVVDFMKVFDGAVPASDYKARMRVFLSVLLDPAIALEGEEDMETLWASSKTSVPSPDAMERSAVEVWTRTGCDLDGAPYVIANLVGRQTGWQTANRPFAPNSARLRALASSLLGAGCAGSAKMTPALRTAMEKLARD